MANILINGNTYSDVKEVQFLSADGSGNVKYVEGADTLGARLANTLTEYTNRDVTIIPASAFAGCKSLVEVSFPNATKVSDESFKECTGLETADFPNCTLITQNAFYKCTALKNLTIGAITNLGRQLFYGSALESFASESVKTIDQDGTFYNCTALKTVTLPNLTTVSGGMTFYGCTALTDVDFGNANKVGANTFFGCAALENVTLRAATMATLANVNAFNNCGGRTVNIRVPSSLVSTYQADTTWKAVTGATLNFVALA